MTTRTIIIDDEFLARERISKLLKPYPEIKIIGHSKNGEEAVKLIQLKEPDLIFLDIQMPGLNGFEVLEKLSPNSIPVVIFTTAFDQYALKAFEVSAVDYLLKPFDEERFELAIAKAKEKLQLQQSSQFQTQLLQLVRNYHQQQSNYLHFLTIKHRGRLIQVPIEDILFFKSAGNYVEIQALKNQKYLYRISMNALIQQLPPKEFLRIHRSYIVNTRYIQSCTYLNNNEYRIKLKNQQSLISAKSFKEQIMAYLS